MEPSGKVKDKIQKFRKALTGFAALLKVDLSLINNEIIVDGLKNGRIQKFEYCIELCWKTGRTFIESELKKKLKYPKQVFKEFLQSEMISEGEYETLLRAIDTRNNLSHEYNEDEFIKELDEIPEYFKAMNASLSAMEAYLNNN